MHFTRLSAFLAFVGVATAHFTLDYPPTRGFDEDKEPTAPCGGFNSVSATRTPFPIGDGFIKLTSTHSPANVLVMISFVENPTDIKNFTFTSTGAAQAPLRDFVQVTGADICIGVDIASMGYANATNGAKATIAIQYVGGDGNLFQCSDVVLASNVTTPSNVTCANEYTTTASGTATGTGTAAPSATTSTRPNGANQLTVGLGFGGAMLAFLGAAVFSM